MSAFLRRCLVNARRKEVEIMLRMIRKCIRKLCPRPVSSARGAESDAAHVVRRAVRLYGAPTARGEASSSTCAAMVRAWLRQRRIIPGKRPLTGGANGHRQPFRLQPSSAAWCLPCRRSKLRIVRFRASAKARSLRCSSSSNHNRFAGLRFEVDEGVHRLPYGFVLTP